MTTLDAVAAHLASLPPTPPGHIRVFRGQTADYPTMQPAGLRGGPSQDAGIFRAWTALAADRFRREAGAPPNDLEDWVLWSQAIAQHYGPGTQFLDVTTSLNIALWFALHSAITEPSGHVFGPPGPYDATTDALAVLPRTRFERHEASGFLYVFDAPVWDGSKKLETGSLLDLSQAPDVFSSSARLQAQSACLLYTVATDGDGDLKPRLAAEPIAVDWPMSGTSCGSITAEDLFPGPKADVWYRRLLSIPLVHRLNTNANRLELSQAIPTTLYLGDDGIRADVIDRLIVVGPDLLWPYLCQQLEARSDWLPEGFDPSGATPIILDLPVFAMTPPLESGGWHHGVAVADLPNTATAHDPASAADIEVALNKVLVEFSPLEFGHWDRVETTEEELSFARGAYIERAGAEFKLWRINQLFPGSRIQVMGPFPFAYNEGNGQIELVGEAGPMPMQWPGKTLLAVITVLRELSAELIACPFPSLSTGEGIIAVHLQGRAARLVKVATSDDAESVYVLRGSSINAPFVPSMLNGGLLMIQSDKGWLATDVERVRDAIRSRAAESRGTDGEGTATSIA